MSNFVVQTHSLNTRAVSRRRRPNRGVVLVVILAILSISLLLFGVWARQAVNEQVRLETQQKRLQAIRLAEAGVERAIALRAADRQFKSGTWSVPAAQLSANHTAEVRMKVVADDEQGTLRYEATAEYPLATIRRVQITKLIEIPTLEPTE